VPGSSPAYADRHVREALGLNPDVVLYLVVPYDLNQQILSKGLSEPDEPSLTASPAAIQAAVGPLTRLEHLVIQSRSLLAAEHFIFQNRETYIRSYLMYGDKADYLRQPFTPVWQRRFAEFDVALGDIADRLHHAGVPLVIVAVPSRAEAALLSSSQLPAHVDPFAFGRAIQAIASKHGAGYVDLMGPVSRIPNAENLYYPVDGHLTSEGHKVVAEALLQKLQDGSVQAFSHCESPQSAERRP
jgi:SGNH hydrolase-like domain, acetyltransferase AlgX